MGNVQMEADQIRYRGQFRNVQEALDNGGGGGGGTTVVANPSGAATADLSKLQVGESIYDIPATAAKIAYSNTDSGLTADDVQEAIDELSGAIPGVATASAPGIVQPDGTTITISEGVISAVGGGGNVNNYSTSEVLIGTYLGANLYRKCFDIGALTGGQTKEFLTDLTGVTVRNYAGYVTRTTDGNLFKCPYVWDTSSQNIGMGIDYSSGYVRCLMRPGSDYSNITGFMTIEYTKNS